MPFMSAAILFLELAPVYYQWSLWTQMVSEAMECSPVATKSTRFFKTDEYIGWHGFWFRNQRIPATSL